MPDENVDNQTSTQDETPTSEGMKQLRDHAKDLERQLREKTDLERQLAFVKAGVDLDSKAGSYFFKAYEGELTADAIKAEAAELGLGGTPQAPEKQEQAPGENQSTDERSALATGARPDEARGEDPRTVAMTGALKLIEQGASVEDAIGDAFATLAIAGYKENDQRVIYRGNQE